MSLKTRQLALGYLLFIIAINAEAFKPGYKIPPDGDVQVSDKINEQRQLLESNTRGKGYGPQSPRDIDQKHGNNHVVFSAAPSHEVMNLCNIHFHKNAEHKGGEFTRYAGNGDGEGYMTGYQYSGKLSEAELKPVEEKICLSRHGSLNAGDTIEVHYVFSTADVYPGPTLEACFNGVIKNPQLRVEAQVYVLVNDSKAADFGKLTEHREIDGLHQVVFIPDETGEPIQYAGSTTGPRYNEAGSPYQVTWGVRPKVAKVHVNTVGKWCEANIFNEDHAHGVRNLVINPDLLSKISP